MALFSKRAFTWIIVISFLIISIVPSMIPSASIRNSVLGVFGAICLLFQLLNLNVASPYRSRKADLIQAWLLLVLTITLLVVNFLV